MAFSRIFHLHLDDSLIVHQRWAKTGVYVPKSPDLLLPKLGFLKGICMYCHMQASNMAADAEGQWFDDWPLSWVFQVCDQHFQIQDIRKSQFEFKQYVIYSSSTL